MSTETTPKNMKPPTVQKEPELAKDSKRESIPVKTLKLLDSNPVDIPGLGGKSSVTGIAAEDVHDRETGKRVTASRCHVIDFFPALRHHRVIFFPENKGEPTVRMVWEGHVRTWEPLA